MRELRLAGLQAWLPGPVVASIEDELASWERADGTRRLLAGDAALWSGADESEWLGWLAPGSGCDDESFGRWRRTAADGGWSSVVLLGMGGSSLGAALLCEGAASVPGRRLIVLDTTDAEEIVTARREIDLATTLFVVASKTGTTVETVSLESYFVAEMESAGLEVGPRVLAITDPGTELAARAVDRGYHLLWGRPDIGGRFSALSPFGLGVLVAMGADPDPLVARAGRERVELATGAAAADLPGVALGTSLAALARHGLDLLEIVPPPALPTLADWLEQLLAESTGKQNAGILPIPCRGVPADKGLVAVAWNGVDVADGAGVLRCEGSRGSTTALGSEILRWQVATAVAGAILGVNPFDQPDVDGAKVAARRRLSEATGHSPRAESMPAAVQRLADESVAARYLAVLAYLPRTTEVVAGVESVRQALAAATDRPATASFGPRYLHSTGQLFKGGTPGAFLFLTRRGAPDVPIPGRGISFDQLQQAQAYGDQEVLAERGRPVATVALSGDLRAGLDAVAKVLSRL